MRLTPPAHTELVAYRVRHTVLPAWQRSLQLDQGAET